MSIDRFTHYKAGYYRLATGPETEKRRKLEKRKTFLCISLWV
jgi:hypothetical protein